tara:strand:- start:1240 stop:1431 length:192 start_codon:yes stop_codon:yes gene_type:complete
MGRSDHKDFDNDRDLNMRKGLKKNKNRTKRKRKRQLIDDFKHINPKDAADAYTYYEDELEGDW